VLPCGCATNRYGKRAIEQLTSYYQGEITGIGEGLVFISMGPSRLLFHNRSFLSISSKVCNVVRFE
jgi:hypothetical protein